MSSKFEACDLRKSYSGRVVVSKVKLDVSQGQIVGLLGPNGAGKTTSFYMMVGLVKVDSGTIKLNGVDITKLPLHERAKKGIFQLKLFLHYQKTELQH